MCSSESRYERISTVSSAERACSEPVSSGATTATVPSPSSRAARNTRSAISPRFATSTLFTAAPYSAIDEQAVDGAEKAPHSPRHVGQPPQPIVGAVLGPGAPGLERRFVVLQMLAPELQSRRSRELRVAGYEGCFRVVEERVLIEIGRPDRQPTVVDDSDFCVNVDLATSARLEERAREEAVVAIRIDQHAELSTCVVCAVVGAGGEKDDDEEIIARRLAQLPG